MGGTYYTSVRITFNDTLTHDRVRDALTATGNHVACLEGGEGGIAPHIHAIFHTAIKTDSIRKQLSRLLPDMVGNKCFSTKDTSATPDKAERYIAKGDGENCAPRIFSHMASYNMDWVARHNEYWQERQRITETRTKALTKREATLTRLALAHFRDKDTTPELVMEWLCDQQVANYKGLNPTYLRSVLNAVLYDTGHKRNIIRFMTSHLDGYL